MPINATVIDNPRSERVRRVCDLTKRKSRGRKGQFLIEGLQAVREAVTWRPEALRDLFVQVEEAAEGENRPSAALRAIVDRAVDASLYVHYASEVVIRRMSPDAQGIVAVGDIEAMRNAREPLQCPERAMIAAFWQVRDPGNAGTVIRAADAAGCDAVVMVDDCVDVFNPKVIRATAGSLFHLPVRTMGTDEFFRWGAEHGVTVMAADIYGTDKVAPESLPDVVASPGSIAWPAAVIFGNEARGLPGDILQRVQRIVSIPMYGRAESLNLAASAAVMLMEMAMSSHIGTM